MSFNLHKLTDRVYWMNSGAPDRASIALVIGDRDAVMLDAGASEAHTQLFLDALTAQKLPMPSYIALTHWHWDHVFGAPLLPQAKLIAHTLTREHLQVMAAWTWDDAALDQRVADGQEIAFCADNIKLELPEPRTIRIRQPDVVFDGQLTLDLSGITCEIHHVGGDHAADSCVMYVPQAKFLFIADCLYDNIYAEPRHYTGKKTRPLLDRILSFDAEHFLAGHEPEIKPRADVEKEAALMRLAANLVDQHGTDIPAMQQAVEAQTGTPIDEDTAYFIEMFAAGVSR